MITVEQLSSRAGAFELRNVSFTVPRGKWGMVIGPAGAGKTTLLETIAGVTPARSGRVLLAGRDVSSWSVTERGVGLVYQHAYLFPHLSVEDNVRYGAVDEPTATQLLDSLDIAALASRRPASLSGGERQLVALARGLARRPGILLLDEPFSALDPRRRASARRVLRHLHGAWQLTVLQVTHDFAEAGMLGDMVILMDQGAVLQSGTAAEVFRRPATPYVAEFLGAENVLAGSARRARPHDSDAESQEWEVTCGSLLIHAIGEAVEGPCHAVIRAEEIVVSRRAPDSSARNVFEAVVSDVAFANAWARVTLDVRGVTLIALVTLPSAEELDLKPGVSVHAGFKAFAVHLC